VTAVIMSAAAMFFVPEAIDRTGHRMPEPLPSPPPALVQQEPAAPPAVVAAPEPPPAPPAQGPAVRAKAGTARTLRSGPVNLTVSGFWSWGMVDRRTGAQTGSANATARSDTASMIKPWIAADFARRAAEADRPVTAEQRKELSQMIRDSVNEIATTYHGLNGGGASIQRMIAICGLTDSRVNDSGSWSTTEISARDGARLATCFADGRAAGPEWTAWLLAEMRGVRGVGRFGIVQAFPAEVAKTVALKNGWIPRDDGRWHISCLAVTAEWALSVLVVYPSNLGRTYGANVCKQVAVQLGALS
jgi:hypothetical protein